jgi:hypothetical protein
VVAVEGGGRQAQWWSDCGSAEDDDDAEKVGPRRRALGEMEVADGTRGGAGAGEDRGCGAAGTRRRGSQPALGCGGGGSEEREASRGDKVGRDGKNKKENEKKRGIMDISSSSMLHS